MIEADLKIRCLEAQLTILRKTRDKLNTEGKPAEAASIEKQITIGEEVLKVLEETKNKLEQAWEEYSSTTILLIGKENIERSEYETHLITKMSVAKGDFDRDIVQDAWLNLVDEIWLNLVDEIWLNLVDEMMRGRQSNATA